MNKAVITVFSLIILVFPAAIWMKQTGDIAFYFSDMAPTGQLLYVLSKLSGLCALALLMWQVMLSLLDKCGMLTISWKGKAHRLAGILIITLALSHLLLFFFGVSLRQGYPAWGMFLPDFKDYYHTHLTFGLIALWGLVGVVIAGIYRLKKKYKNLQLLHKGYVPVAILVYIHALSVGTEAQSMYGTIYYVFVALLSLGLLFLWALKSMRNAAPNKVTDT